MAKPTLMQRYFLFNIAAWRWISAICAMGGLTITISSLPSVMRMDDPRLTALFIGSGVAGVLIGSAFYVLGTKLQRTYRAHIASQID